MFCAKAHFYINIIIIWNNIKKDVLSLFLTLNNKNEWNIPEKTGQYVYPSAQGSWGESSLKGHNIHGAGSKKPVGLTIHGMYAPRDKRNGGTKILGYTIRVEPTRDVSSGDETSLHRFIMVLVCCIPVCYIPICFIPVQYNPYVISWHLNPLTTYWWFSPIKFEKSPRALIFSHWHQISPEYFTAHPVHCQKNVSKIFQKCSCY